MPPLPAPRALTAADRTTLKFLRGNFGTDTISPEGAALRAQEWYRRVQPMRPEPGIPQTLQAWRRRLRSLCWAGAIRGAKRPGRQGAWMAGRYVLPKDD